MIYVLRCKILLNSQFHDEHVFLFLFISSPRLIFAEFYKAISEVLFPSHISQCVCSRVLQESNKTDDKKLDERERDMRDKCGRKLIMNDFHLRSTTRAIQSESMKILYPHTTAQSMSGKDGDIDSELGRWVT